MEPRTVILSLLCLYFVGFGCTDKRTDPHVAKFGANSALFAFSKVGLFPEKTEISVLTNAAGKKIFLNPGLGDKILVSEDGGKTWEKRQDSIHYGGHSDWILDSTGQLVNLYATESSINPMKFARLLAFYSKNGQTKEVFQSNVVTKAKVPEQLRQVKVGGKANHYLLTFARTESRYPKLRIFASSDLAIWSDLGDVHELSLAGIFNKPAIGVNAAGEYFLAIQGMRDIRKAEFRGKEFNYEFGTGYFTLLKSSDNGQTWNVNLEEPGAQVAQRKWRPFGVMNQRLFFTSENEGYLIWKQTFGRSAIKEGVKGQILEEVLYTKSVDQGKNWSKPQRLNDAEFFYEDLMTWRPDPDFMSKALTRAVTMKSSVSANGKYIFVVWRDIRDLNHIQLYFTYSNDHGKTWARNKPLAPEVSPNGLAFDVIVNNDGQVQTFFKTQDGMLYQGKASL